MKFIQLFSLLQIFATQPLNDDHLGRIFDKLYETELRHPINLINEKIKGVFFRLSFEVLFEQYMQEGP
ncbi:hypothetical protein BV378_07820 [Nostoc sp. RF31YmG]|nr:hypothetical protein BV378_07820 [Nostoc sp. RF31YmG]